MPNMNARTVSFLAAVLLAASSSSSAAEYQRSDGPRLKELAKRRGVEIGPNFVHQASHDFTAITGSLKKAVDDAPLDGACLLVVKGGQTICQECFGQYQPDTVVSIASASEWLSAATMMTLVDEGKLSLDDPVSKHLPKFTGKRGEITIRQLLSHTSGLPGDDPAIGTFRITLREAADQIAEIPLVADPGKEFRYGGVSMQVADGHAICQGFVEPEPGGSSWSNGETSRHLVRDVLLYAPTISGADCVGSRAYLDSPVGDTKGITKGITEGKKRSKGSRRLLT